MLVFDLQSLKYKERRKSDFPNGKLIQSITGRVDNYTELFLYWASWAEQNVP